MTSDVVHLVLCPGNAAIPLRLVFAPTADHLGSHPELHPSLSRGAIRVFFHSEILLGQAVDPRAGAPLFTNDLDHAAAQAEVAVGVFRIEDTERDGAPEAQDVGLGPSLRCVENDILAVQIHPHRRYVRCPVWQNDANVNKHLLLEYLALLRGQLPMRHRHIWMLQSHLSSSVLSNPVIYKPAFVDIKLFTKDAGNATNRT